jgi:hypothetical protein
MHGTKIRHKLDFETVQFDKVHAARRKIEPREIAFVARLLRVLFERGELGQQPRTGYDFRGEVGFGSIDWNVQRNTWQSEEMIHKLAQGVTIEQLTLKLFLTEN